MAYTTDTISLGKRKTIKNNCQRRESLAFYTSNASNLFQSSQPLKPEGFLPTGNMESGHLTWTLMTIDALEPQSWQYTLIGLRPSTANQIQRSFASGGGQLYWSSEQLEGPQRRIAYSMLNLAATSDGLFLMYDFKSP